MCELENAAEIQKYPKTFIHDCSLPSSSLLGSVFVSRISESEPEQPGELHCFLGEFISSYLSLAYSF